MTSAQIRFAISTGLSVCSLIAVALSYSYFPGTGQIRVALAFGAIYLLLRPFECSFKAVAARTPMSLNGSRAQAVFLVWLIFLLGAVLLAQSLGYRVFAHRGGLDVMLGTLILLFPLFIVFWWRAYQVYRFLKTAGT